MSEYINEYEQKLAELEEQSKQYIKHNSKYYPDGIYVKKIKILEVIDNSNHPINSPNNFTFNSGKKPEICLTVKFSYEADDFNNKGQIVVKESKTNIMSSWDWENWKPKAGFRGFSVNPNNNVYAFMKQVIPAGDIYNAYMAKKLPDFSKVKDMEFYSISFFSGVGVGDYDGKGNYNTWDFFLPVVDGNDDILVEMFKEKEEKKGGYSSWKPKEYLQFKESKKNHNELSTPEANDEEVGDLPF